MNGIALIIPNADFSGSNLGKVTPVQDTETIVTTYLTRVGGGTENKQKLIILYNTLNELGALDTLDIFPMLGDTLAHRCIGLKPEGESYLFDALMLGANASLNVNGGLSFADTNPNITGSEAGVVNKMVDSVEGFFTFVNAALKSGSRGVMSKAAVGALDPSASYIRHDLHAMPGGGYKEVLNAYRDITQTWTESSIPSDTSVFNPYYFHNTGDSSTRVLNSYSENGLIATSTGFANTNPVHINNIFGAMAGDASSHFFCADVNLYAVGIVDVAKLSDVKTALIAYCS